jgi:hypothetical protein
MSLQALNSVLWNERQLFELLLFKLEEEQLLLEAGKSRWLPHSTREVENVLEQIKDIELSRAIESDAVALELGLPANSPLSLICEHAPEPWDDLLVSHRVAFVQLTAEIEGLVSQNRELLTTSQRAAQETLANFQRDTSTYDESGAASTGEARPRLLDQSL